MRVSRAPRREARARGGGGAPLARVARAALRLRGRPRPRRDLARGVVHRAPPRGLAPSLPQRLGVAMPRAPRGRPPRRRLGVWKPPPPPRTRATRGRARAPTAPWSPSRSATRGRARGPGSRAAANAAREGRGGDSAASSGTLLRGPRPGGSSPRTRRSPRRRPRRRRRPLRRNPGSIGIPGIVAPPSPLRLSPRGLTPRRRASRPFEGVARTARWRRGGARRPRGVGASSRTVRRSRTVDGRRAVQGASGSSSRADDDAPSSRASLAALSFVHPLELHGRLAESSSAVAHASSARGFVEPPTRFSCAATVAARAHHRVRATGRAHHATRDRSRAPADPARGFPVPRGDARFAVAREVVRAREASEASRSSASSSGRARGGANALRGRRRVGSAPGGSSSGGFHDAGEGGAPRSYRRRDDAGVRPAPSRNLTRGVGATE